MTAVVLIVAAIVAAAVVAGGIALWRIGRAPRLRSTGDLRMHRLADGVYVYREHFSNAAVFVLDGGVVVVDTLVSPLAARRLRDEIERITDLPIRYVVNTHYHGDHTGGNAVFPEAEIIGTAHTARLVVDRDDERTEYARTFGLEFQEVHPTVGPTRTFTDRLELQVGGDTLELRQIGAAETPDACVVHWPARRVVACGDGVATWDYPYLGVPFLDEGLRDDGAWPGFLATLRDWRPAVLIAGHGPPLVGEAAVAERLDLLIALMTDLLAATRRELAAGTPLPELVDRVHGELAHYPARPELAEAVTGQRFAIYRCVNNLSPERAGKGWWHDLRPSVVERAGAGAVERELRDLADADAVCARARALVARGDRALAISLLEAWVARHPRDADTLGLLSDVLFDGAAGIAPAVDSTEYLALAGKAAKRALAIDHRQPLALLTLGACEVFGGMVLAQPMHAAIERLEIAVGSGALDRKQRRKASFFLGKAHQYARRPAESDRWLRRALPLWARPAFPLLRERLRCTP